MIIEIDITHRCNMKCRHCNRLCNAENEYAVIRHHKDMKKQHIDFLCQEISRYQKGRVKLLRILGGEPLLSPIIDYAIKQFEILVKKGYVDDINIVTNGTVKPSDTCMPYLVYSPVCIKEMIAQKGDILTTREVYKIKNEKHRNITVSPIDVQTHYKICDRIDICGINFSVYGFSYTASCFPAMFVEEANHKRFLHYLPDSINDFFDENFEKDVCSLCVFAIDNYKEIISRNPQMQKDSYVGHTWSKIICHNKKSYEEPSTDWIDSYTDIIDKQHLI